MTASDDDLFETGTARLAALGTALSPDALQGVAREVVTQLARKRDMPGLVRDPRHPDAARIDLLCAMLVSTDNGEARRMMRGLQNEGLTLEVLFSRYLAAAAARLGAMWDDDRLTFAEVSIGVARIFDLVDALRNALPPPRITHADPVLFTSVPGEEHSVGLTMAAELFRQNGWDVEVLTGVSHDGIMARLAGARFLVLGLSSGGRASAAALARLVHAVRVAHPDIFILISGRIVTEEAELVALMAPDGAVATVEDALETIEALRAV